MTLTSATNRVQYSGDGSTVSFPVTFVFWDADDLQVILTSSSGVETTWVRGTQYTVSGGSGSTGTVTVDTSPTDYTPASGTTLTIKSNLSDFQNTDLAAGGPFPASSVEQQLDKIVRLVQQKAEALGRAIKFRASSTSTNITMPEPSANKVVGWNSGGTDLENKTPNTSAYVTLPSSATNGGIVTFNGTSGTSLQDSTYTITAAGAALIDDATAAAQATTLGLGTGDSPQFTAVNIGHATDTTITRVSAGVIAVEGNTLASVAASQAEMEAGTEVALRTMSPLRVAQAIAALATGVVVKQIIPLFKQDTFSTATTGSWVAVTGLSQAITLTNSANTVLVIGLLHVSNGGPTLVGAKVLRGATDLQLPTTPGSRTPAGAGVVRESTGTSGIEPMHFMVSDAPGSVGPHTYSVSIYAESASSYVNRSATDTDAATYPRAVSSLLLIEYGS